MYARKVTSVLSRQKLETVTSCCGFAEGVRSIAPRNVLPPGIRIVPSGQVVRAAGTVAEDAVDVAAAVAVGAMLGVVGAVVLFTSVVVPRPNTNQAAAAPPRARTAAAAR